jgi:hypothetical protein
MVKILLRAKLYDQNISHTYDAFGYYTFTGSKKPALIEYSKDESQNYDLSLFTDDFFEESIILNDSSKTKVGFLVESKIYYPDPYVKIEKVANLFDLIVTHDKQTLQRYTNAVFAPFGGSWAEEKDIFNNWSKSKLISCIASKKIDTHGHLLRHRLISLFSKKYKWDLWGGGYRKFDSKRKPLASYMYSVAIQNGRYPTYFTEILTDPFLFKTIPIYWGAPDIGSIFNSDGFYTFDSDSDLQEILEKISPADYLAKKDAIEENYQIALGMRNTDALLFSAITSNLDIVS